MTFLDKYQPSYLYRRCNYVYTHNQLTFNWWNILAYDYFELKLLSCTLMYLLNPEDCLTCTVYKGEKLMQCLVEISEGMSELLDKQV